MTLAGLSRRPLPVPLLAALVFGGWAIVLVALTGGISPGLIEADEGGHYVNALFLGDWLRAGLPSPLPFAKDFYAHFPRLTIGHWPPAWYMLEAPVFALFRPSPLVAAWISAFLAGVPGIAVLWGLAQAGRPRLGWALGLAYVALPLVVDTGRYLLVDQPLTLAVALAVMAWAAAAARPGWPRMLGFALLAAACPLIKGNGALIALVPALDVALTGRWSLLRRPALWGAAAVTLVLVAPWYWLSFAISAEGFNYAPGLAYAWLALHDNGAAILANVGLAGVALAIGGAVLGWTGGKEQRVARLSLAVVVATLLFQSAVPASLAPRYVAPLLPWIVVLAGLALGRLGERGRVGIGAAVVVGAWALWPAAGTLASLPAKPDLGAPGIAATMARRGGIWLVDGSSGTEGALIAAATYTDGGSRRLWAIRASQWLSTSDFMGRGYRLTAADPAAVRGVLDRLGVVGIVSVAARGRPAYPHSVLLRAAVANGDYLLRHAPYVRGDGETLVAVRRAPVTPNAALLAADPASAKVGKIVGRLD